MTNLDNETQVSLILPAKSLPSLLHATVFLLAERASLTVSLFLVTTSQHLLTEVPKRVYWIEVVRNSNLIYKTTGYISAIVVSVYVFAGSIWLFECPL